MSSKDSLAQKYASILDFLIADMRETGKGEQRIQLKNGKHTGEAGGKWTYSFRAPTDTRILEDAEINLDIRGKRYSCDRISKSKSHLQVTLDADPGAELRECWICLSQIGLLEVLRDRLEGIVKGGINFSFNQELADSTFRNGKLLTPQWKLSSFIAKGLNMDQENAVRAAFENAVLFIWGPPGTGKTATLSAFSENLLHSPLRLLICSNTHRAVDQVLLKLCKNLGEDHPAIKQSKIVRSGAIQHEELKAKWGEQITAAGIQQHRTTQLRTQQSSLESRRQNEQSDSAILQAVIQDFKAADSCSQRVTELERAFQKSQAVYSQAQQKRVWAAQQVQVLSDELKGRDQASALLRWLKRSRERILSDLQLQRQALVRAHDEFVLIDEQRVNSKRLLTEQQNKLELISSRLRGCDQAQTQSNLDQHIRTIADLSSKIQQVKAEIRATDENQIMRGAKVVGATIASIYSSPKRFSDFDVIVVDEASMVLLPALYFVVGLAGKKAVISGDFRQLQPIIQTDKPEIQEVLGHDIFVESGVADSLVNQVQQPANAVMLQQQYRMDDAICQLISKRMYAGKLKTAPDRTGSNFRGVSPFFGPLHIVDTSGMMPLQQRGITNWLHATVVRQLVKSLKDAGAITDDRRVGICSPFKKQATLIANQLKSLDLGRVSHVGTVHTFQGDESQIFIFDTTRSSGKRSSKDWFSAVSPDEEGSRLLNVAISRAQHCLIVIANLSYFRNHLLPDSMLAGLFEGITQAGTVIDVRDVLAGSSTFVADANEERDGSSRPKLFDSRSFTEQFSLDLEASQSHTAICSGFVTPERISHYLNVFGRKRGRVQIKCVRDIRVRTAA